MSLSTMEFIKSNATNEFKLNSLNIKSIVGFKIKRKQPTKLFRKHINAWHCCNKRPCKYSTYFIDTCV